MQHRRLLMGCVSAGSITAMTCAALLAACDGQSLSHEDKRVRGFDNTFRWGLSYGLYVCTPYYLTCEPGKQDVKTVDGIAHYKMHYRELAHCQGHKSELSKANPDKRYMCWAVRPNLGWMISATGTHWDASFSFLATYSPR